MFTTDERKDINCQMFVYDTRANEGPVAIIVIEGEKVTSGLWGPFDEYIVTGHADGSVCHYDYTVSYSYLDVSYSCLFLSLFFLSLSLSFSPPPSLSLSVQ